MSATVAGLVGAIIGALAGVLGTLISHYLQARAEKAEWHKTKREEAYANSLRYLLKAINMRTNLTAEGYTYISKDAISKWFDALNEAQIWLTSATIYCSDAYTSELNGLLDDYSASVAEFIGTELNVSSEDDYDAGLQPVSYKVDQSLLRMPDDLLQTYRAVLSIARKDLAQVL